MYLSQFFIISSDGTVLLSKEFRNDVTESIKDVFQQQILTSKELYKPYLMLPELSVQCFLYERNSVYFCAATKSILEMTAAFEILSRFADLIADFFGPISPKLILCYLPSVYEILDEFMIDGYVQIDTMEKMKPFLLIGTVQPEQTKENLQDFGLDSFLSAFPQPLMKQSGENSSRDKEIKLDIFEKLAVVVEKDATVSKKELIGNIMLQCQPTGSYVKINFDPAYNFPDSSSSLSTSSCLESYDFNECVQKDNLVEKKEITVQMSAKSIPVAEYEQSGILSRSLPFVIDHIIEILHGSKDMNLHVKLKTNLSAMPESVVNKLIVCIPVPRSTTSIATRFDTSLQSATFDYEKKQIVWNAREIPDDFSIKGAFRLINAIGVDSSIESSSSEIGPIKLEFSISNYTQTGLTVTGLDFQPAEPTRTMRWIRYMTSSDNYIVKI